MENNKQDKKRLPAILRWTGRITGLIMIGLILLFFIGEGGLEEPALFINPGIWFIFILPGMGHLLGWKWEIPGGLLSVGGLIAFYIYDMILSGDFPDGPFFILIAAPGFCYLASAILRRKKDVQNAEAQE